MSTSPDEQIASTFREALFERRQPKVSCWYHFAPQYRDPAAACEAHLHHLETYELDFLKVMFEYGYPRAQLGRAGVVQSVDDLRRLKPLGGDASPLLEQLDLLRRLRDWTEGRVPMTTTVFHPWMELRNLLESPKEHHRPPVIEGARDPRDEQLTAFLREDAEAVAGALAAMGQTLAEFARLCLEAGADGVYLATRDDWVDVPDNRAALGLTESASVYDELVAPHDREILAAAADGWFNFVHLCGAPLRFDRYLADANVNVIHWADRITGPSIADAVQMVRSQRDSGTLGPLAMAAGVDNLNTLPNGRPLDIVGEVQDARAAAGGMPLIIAPGCTYDPDAVPADNIRALVAAARS